MMFGHVRIVWPGSHVPSSKFICIYRVYSTLVYRCAPPPPYTSVVSLRHIIDIVKRSTPSSCMYIIIIYPVYTSIYAYTLLYRGNVRARECPRERFSQLLIQAYVRELDWWRTTSRRTRVRAEHYNIIYIYIDPYNRY